MNKYLATISQTYSASVVLTLVLLATPHGSEPLSVQYERIEQLTGSDTVSAKNLRIRKYNRTVSVLNGTLDVFRDLDDNFFFTIELAYSPLGNNQFINSPFRIPRQDMCHFFNTTYRTYREYYRETTNLPDAGVCPLPAKQYWVKDKMLVVDLVNHYFQNGLWKLTFYLYEKGIDLPLIVVEMLLKIQREEKY